jgi:hypothetical protein
MSHQQTKHELLLCKLEQRLVGERYCVQIRNLLSGSRGKLPSISR